MKDAKQNGITLPEILIASFLGIALVLAGYYFFDTQSTGYRKLKLRAQAQIGFKLASSSISRDIYNAGGFLEKPEDGFSPGKDRLEVSFLDLNARYCKTGEVASVTYASVQKEGAGIIQQTIRCNGTSRPIRELLRTPGVLKMEFSYQDKNGSSTTDTSRIKAVAITIQLDARTKNRKPLFSLEKRFLAECPNF
jgi:hypothetical protein